MKTDDSKKWSEMTLKCEASFFKCDKCEVKYQRYDPRGQDMQVTLLDYVYPLLG